MPKARKTSRRRRATSSEERITSKTIGTGWGAVSARKKEVANAADYENKIRDFWLSAGESAIIQFISEEPYCMDGHTIKDDKGKWGFSPCQLTHQRHCLMCREGIKKTWRAAFKIIDYRGTWDSDKKRFKHDKKVEKIWYCGTTIAEQIKTILDKKGKKLTDMVFEVTRSGSGKSTTYMLEQAWDDDTDTKITPCDWEEQYESLEEICKPLSDEQLEAKGFSAPDFS